MSLSQKTESSIWLPWVWGKLTFFFQLLLFNTSSSSTLLRLVESSWENLITSSLCECTCVLKKNQQTWKHFPPLFSPLFWVVNVTVFIICGKCACPVGYDTCSTWLNVKKTLKCPCYRTSFIESAWQWCGLLYLTSYQKAFCILW